MMRYGSGILFGYRKLVRIFTLNMNSAPCSVMEAVNPRQKRYQRKMTN